MRRAFYQWLSRRLFKAAALMTHAAARHGGTSEAEVLVISGGRAVPIAGGAALIGLLPLILPLIPGLVSSVKSIVSAIMQARETPDEVRAHYARIDAELALVETAVANAPQVT